MELVDERGRTEVFARLQELIAIGRRYDMFAQKDPCRGAVQIAELNAPGLRENAWDLQWVLGVLRAKVARVSPAITLELCRPQGDPEHDPALMDVLMPAAIVAACIAAMPTAWRLNFQHVRCGVILTSFPGYFGG